MLSALRTLEGKNSGGADENTGTWGGGTDDIKPELKPLEQKIIQLLQSNGEVKDTDLPILQALADLGGLNSDELQVLIEQVKEKQANQSPQQKAFQQWVANINSAVARGDELSPQQIQVLVEAGEASTGKTTPELQSILAVKEVPVQQDAGSSQAKDDDVTLVAKPEQSGSGSAGKWIGIAVLLIVLAGGGYFGFTNYQQEQYVEQIKKAQEYLKILDYEVVKTGKLDSRTRKAIKAFEEWLDLPVTGEVDALLLRNLEYALEFRGLAPANAETNEQNEKERQAEVISQKQRAEQIKKAQGYLKQLDYVVAENGQLDARTQKAIEAFEESQDLMVTGAVDTILLSKLEAVLDAKHEAAAIAKAKKQDSDAWNAAKSSGTINAYQQYIANQPQGQYLTQANKAIDGIKLENSKVPLNIVVSPADATIQITNIKEKYRDGIKLIPGEYTVKISQKGYENRTDTVLLSSKNDTFRYELKRALPEPIIALINSMKPIPAGSFMMGCSTGDTECYDDEKPRHNVNVNSFSLMATKVTKGQFASFVYATGYRTDAEKNAGENQGCSTWNDGQFQWSAGVNWQNAQYKGLTQSDNHPVVCVSHNDAEAFITWVNEQSGERYRLPSEAEWEYAARAGSNAKFSFCNDASALCRYGNVADDKTHPDGMTWNKKTECNDGYVFTAPVAQYQANAYGLYDMQGNVWEWTADYWNEDYSGAPSNGRAWQRGDSSRRVARGGSWLDSPRYLRASYREDDGVTNRDTLYGFRLARD